MMEKKRGLKLSTNLQDSQKSFQKSQIGKVEDDMRWVDYDALTIKDAYCKEQLDGESHITPGKALFSLSHSHKKKSLAWMINKEEEDNLSDQENAPSPLGKQGTNSKSKTRTNATKEPTSAGPPSKRIKEHLVVKSCPASTEKSKNDRTLRASTTGRAVDSPLSLRQKVLSSTVTPLKIGRIREDSNKRVTRSGIKSKEIREIVNESPKRSSSIAKKAIPKSTRSTRSSSQQSNLTTPTTRRSSRIALKNSSPLNESDADDNDQENISDREESEEEEMAPRIKESLSVRKKRVAMAKIQTPKTVRYEKKRVAVKQLAKVLDDSLESDGTDSDSEDEEEEDQNQKEMKNSDLAGPSYQTYFEDIHGLKSLKTSDHTLSKLPILDPQEYLQSLEHLAQENQTEIQQQHTRVTEYFNDWYFESQNGFNLVFYGYGSKKDLLNEFCQTYFKGNPILTINGFFPNLHIKTIFDMILNLINHQGPKGSNQDQLTLIQKYFTSASRKVPSLVLLIHNIDGPSLRNTKTQALLSVLADTPNILFVASIDHINAPLLWDSVISTRFNWIWHDATSFAPWIQETTFETSILIKSTSLGPRGVIYVLKSLNANARGIFGILAKHQIASSEDSTGESRHSSSDVGMSYSMLYQESCNFLYVTNELTFRTLLTEFKDHKIMVMKKGSDGVEILEIPLDVDSLISLVEDMSL